MPEFYPQAAADSCFPFKQSQHSSVIKHITSVRAVGLTRPAHPAARLTQIHPCLSEQTQHARCSWLRL
jgi:hypothetical protein